MHYKYYKCDIIIPVISEHSSEDEKVGSSFVGRIPTGGSSMGSRSFKEISSTR